MKLVRSASDYGRGPKRWYVEQDGCLSRVPLSAVFREPMKAYAYLVLRWAPKQAVCPHGASSYVIEETGDSEFKAYCKDCVK